MVEFQCKAVSKQQKVAIIDAMRVVWVLLAITRRMTRAVRIGARMRDSRALPKADPTVLASLQATAST